MSYLMERSNRCILMVFLCSLVLLSGCRRDSEEPTLYDSERPYRLPYTYGEDRFVIQGYSGPFGHSGFELDFVMPVGTPVLAARSGVVTAVQDSQSGNCPIEKNCSNNFVYIDHLDGSYAAYLHIKQFGACVSSGMVVNQGDVIALAGNVGISALPHLHLGIMPFNGEPPAFADVNQFGSGVPEMGNFYMSFNRVGEDYCNE